MAGLRTRDGSRVIFFRTSFGIPLLVILSRRNYSCRKQGSVSVHCSETYEFIAMMKGCHEFRNKAHGLFR